jgi:hypothetical protein
MQRLPKFAALRILSVCALLVNTSCGKLGTIDAVFTQGQQFAHYVKLPAGFRVPKIRDALLAAADQYTFRLSPMSPNVLLVAACTYPVLNHYQRGPEARVCSDNSFAIDTGHDFAVREATSEEWSHAIPMDEKEMDNPYKRTLKLELAKPPILKPVPIVRRDDAETEGYKYRGNEYRRRGNWIISLNFGDSDDGKLLVLAGVDKRKFPSQEPASADTEVFTRLSGLVTVDVFASDPSHRLAALDLDCHTNVNMARRRISLVNSRWLAIGLDLRLDNMLLMDFAPPK